MDSGSFSASSPLVVTRTPLRVSFAGGGTDLPAFYERNGHGAVLSTAINRYVYVTVKRHSELFFEPVRLNYSKSEEVDHVEELENNIARECLKFLEVDPPIYISTVGDVPASTGLGGSSAFAVGLLNALHAYRGERVSAGQLAEEASYIEIEVLGEPIGKQDQYAAAFGGMNVFRFEPGGAVTIQHQRLTNDQRELLFRCLLLFWTGHQRDASGVLTEQAQNAEAMYERLLRMRDQALALQELFSRNGAVDMCELGRVVSEGWELKRGLASSITTNQIDRWYERALSAGAEGGKLCGAGGGGFLMFVVQPERQAAVRSALAELEEIEIGHETHGSEVVISFHTR
jgi:D-glycero-alpha-D-manno-heptose-7-phosphate kinase